MHFRVHIQIPNLYDATCIGSQEGEAAENLNQLDALDLKLTDPCGSISDDRERPLGHECITLLKETLHDGLLGLRKSGSSDPQDAYLALKPANE